MHSYRFRYIFLGLFIYVQSAYGHMCGYEFDDVASKSFLSDIVFEGTFLGKYQNDLEERYNASFQVNRLHKGKLPMQHPGNRYRLVIAGDFGPASKDECVAPLNASGPLIVFLSYNVDPAVPMYRISAFPERATPKSVKLINSAIECNESTPKSDKKRCAQSPRAQVVAKSKSWSVGRTITLRCKIQGNPTPKVTWIKDNLIIEGDNRRVSIKTNRRSSRLRIKKCTGADDGIYYCRANNVKGQSTEDSVVVVQGKSKPDAHTKLCTKQSYCLNGGQCFLLESLGTKFCKCGKGFTGRRCQMQEPLIFTDPPRAERRDAQQFDRTMTISCIIIGALVLAAICITAYCMAKQKRDKFYRKKAERERQKAAANGTYQKVPKEEAPQGPLVVQTLTPVPPATPEPKPVKTMGIQTESELFPLMVQQDAAQLLQREPDRAGSQSAAPPYDSTDGYKRSHSRSNSTSGNYSTYDGRRNSSDRHGVSDRRNSSDRHNSGSERRGSEHRHGGERRGSRQSQSERRHSDRHSDHHGDRHSDRHSDKHSSSDRRSDQYGDRDRHSERHGDRSVNGGERRNSRHSDRQGERERADRHGSSSGAAGSQYPQHYEGSPPGSIERLSQYGGGSMSGSDPGNQVRSRPTGVSASAERLDHQSSANKPRASNPQRLVNAVVESSDTASADLPRRSSPATSRTHPNAAVHSGNGGGGFEQTPLQRVRRTDSDSGSRASPSQDSSRGSRGSRGSKRSLELGDHSDYDNQPSDLEVNMESEVDMHGLDASGDEVADGRGRAALTNRNNHNKGSVAAPPGEPGEAEDTETETSESDSSSSGGGQEAVLFEKLKHNPQMARSKSSTSRTSTGSLHHWDEYGNTNNTPGNFSTQQYAFNPYATDSSDVIDNKYVAAKHPAHAQNAYQNHRKSRANHHIQDGLIHMVNDDPDATPV